MEMGWGNDEFAWCKYCKINTMPSRINHPSLMLPSGRTFCLTKSFNVVMKRSKKNIYLLEIGLAAFRHILDNVHQQMHLTSENGSRKGILEKTHYLYYYLGYL
jgi:hypothetical protein